MGQERCKSSRNSSKFIHLRNNLQDIVLSQEPDKFRWSWTSDGNYSSQSAYNMLHLDRTHLHDADRIWETWAPLRVKIFVWLATLDRVWTTDWRRRHHLEAHDSCWFCDQESETCNHMLVTCPFARMIWWEVIRWAKCRCNFAAPGTMQDWWQDLQAQQETARRRGFNSLFMLVL